MTTISTNSTFQIIQEKAYQAESTSLMFFLSIFLSTNFFKIINTVSKGHVRELVVKAYEGREKEHAAKEDDDYVYIKPEVFKQLQKTPIFNSNLLYFPSESPVSSSNFP